MSLHSRFARESDSIQAPLQIDRLAKEREVLVRNISCLFKTAQLEIQRKDTELRHLRERIASHTA